MTDATSNIRPRPEQSSGEVTIEGTKVTWHSEDLVFGWVDLSEVIVVGEHTNSNGPWFDDWFLDLVVKDGTWFSISMYANNIDSLTSELSNLLGSRLELSGLANSTEWKSIVKFPFHLVNRPLFILTPSETYKVPKTFFEKLLCSVGLGRFDTTQNIALTEEVQQVVQNASR